MDKTLADSTKHNFDFNAFMREELADKVLVKLPTVFGIDFSITKDVLMMLIAALIIVVFCYLAMRRPKLVPVPTSLQNILETMAEFLENDVAKPFLGEQTHRFMPFLLTAFLFILANNLMGVIPGASKATANISVTAGLAGITFMVVQISGIRQHGFVGYLRHIVPPGVPKLLLPIMIPVELLGMLTKPFALSIRLFANMTAGHIVIAAFIGLIFLLQSWAVAPFAVLSAVGVSLLEILIAFIQAYIFTLLSAVFIGLAIQGDH